MRSKHVTVLIGLMVAATLLFSGSGMAVAQDTSGTVSPQSSALPCDGSVAPPSSGVLCDQMDLGGGSGTSVSSQNWQGADASICQFYGAPTGCLTSEAADDFFVPTTGGVKAWIVDKVEVNGYYEPGKPNLISAVNIKFFINVLKSGQNVPGNLRHQASFPVTQSSNVFTVNLNPPVLLAAGQMYWLEFQVVLDGGRIWYWEERTVQTNSPSAWQTTSYDPTQTGCTSWKPRIATPPTGCGIGSGTPLDKPDLLFRLSGRTTTTFFETFLPLVSR